MSWDDAQEFCAKLTAHVGGACAVRLPTEAEWECACRAGTATHFHFGDVPNTDLANYNGTFTWNGAPQGEYRQATTDVGSFPPSPWGLFDLHGNVWEWCADRSRPYPTNANRDSAQESGENLLVLRGGSWCDDPQFCRAASRFRLAPAGRDDYVGFRVAFRPD